jgi:hypothetical protein
VISTLPRFPTLCFSGQKQPQKQAKNERQDIGQSRLIKSKIKVVI